jgi:dimeric dUTPase (all-alpha-NTP-PPase superfamily)
MDDDKIPKKVINFRIEENLIEEFKKISELEERTISQNIRWLIKEYVTIYKERLDEDVKNIVDNNK